jgi:hypothetical protein
MRGFILQYHALCANKTLFQRTVSYFVRQTATRKSERKMKNSVVTQIQNFRLQNKKRFHKT